MRTDSPDTIIAISRKFLNFSLGVYYSLFCLIQFDEFDYLSMDAQISLYLEKKKAKEINVSVKAEWQNMALNCFWKRDPARIDTVGHPPS